MHLNKNRKQKQQAKLCWAAASLFIVAGIVIIVVFPRITGIATPRARPAAPNNPFKAEQFRTVASLLDAHQQWQATTLQHVVQDYKNQVKVVQPPPVLVVRFWRGGGWGNKIPSLVTGAWW